MRRRNPGLLFGARASVRLAEQPAEPGIEADVLDERLVAAQAFLNFGERSLIPAPAKGRQGSEMGPGELASDVVRTVQSR